MSGFVYYIPQAAPPTPEQIQQLGLGYVFEQAQPVCRGTMRGPGGQGEGQVIGNERSTPINMIKFAENEQSWRQIHGTDTWVGYYRHRVPTPGTLARADQLNGIHVKLGDNNAWLIPIARGWIEEDNEPKYLEMLPSQLQLQDGHWTRGGTKPRYRQLQRIAAEYFDARVDAVPEGDDDEITLTFDLVDDAATSAVTAIQANYLVGATEVDELGLLDETTVVKVLEALIDIRGLLELQKKRHTASAG